MCCALPLSLSLSLSSYQLPAVYSPLFDAIGAIAEECCVCLEKLYHAQGTVSGEGEVLLYIIINHILRYVPPQGVWFLCLFGLKMGINFVHFGLELGMVFEGTTGVYEHIILSFQFQMIKKEKEICKFQMDLKNFVCLRSNLSNDNIISA